MENDVATDWRMTSFMAPAELHDALAVQSLVWSRRKGRRVSKAELIRDAVAKWLEEQRRTHEPTSA